MNSLTTCPTEDGGFLSSPGKMANGERKLARGNSSRTAGWTAYARRKVSRADVEDGQELFPGIPNHVTMGNIASKLDWKTCNVLQMVNKKWRQAIYSRNLYDARVLSKSTKAFLVMLSYRYEDEDLSYEDGDEEPVRKLILTLYSCTDNCFVRLPPIPSIPSIPPRRVQSDCICLEGRIYLWLRAKRGVQLYVLDLAGHRKWAERKPVNSSDVWCNGLGVLDGRVYRFRQNPYFVLTPGDPFPGRELSIRDKVRTLPYTEIYDPVHDAWSLITPAPPVDDAWSIITPAAPVRAVASLADLEHHLASFSNWTKEKLATDPSKTFLINGRYESYFSEWKQKQALECSTTSTVDNDSANAMATQVYYSHSCLLPTFAFRNKEVLFFGGKLVKYEKLSRYNTRAEFDVEEYDARTNKWEHWKLVQTNFQPLKQGCTFSIDVFNEFTVADNSLWAIVGLSSMNDGWFFTWFLVRSPELVGIDNGKSVTWIDTGVQMGTSIFSPLGNILRPVYL